MIIRRPNKRNTYATFMNAIRLLRRKNYIRSLAAVAVLIMILNINRARNSDQFLIETNVKENVDEEKKTSPFYLNAPKPNTDAKELHLYLHVGPGKMATTTIQNSLKEDTALLNEDGYCVFDPVTMHTHIGHLLRKQNSTFIIGDPKWNEFLSFLDQCHSLQQNVLLSSEGLGLLKSAVWNEVMKQAFSRWTFHIVVGYRRYYEWIPSLYYQIYRKTTLADSIQSNIPPINEFVSDNHRLKLWTYRYLQHWKRLVGNDLKFSIYNMHEDRNILKTFYCTMLNDTKTACSKHNNDTAKRLNKRFSLEYHRLVIEANNHYELLPDGIDLNKAATELETIHRREMGMKTREFPRICLDDDKSSKLLNVSLEMEEKLLPDWFSSENGEADIQRKFKKFADRELCSVDIIKIFKGEQYSKMWTAWLDHLGVEI